MWDGAVRTAPPAMLDGSAQRAGRPGRTLSGVTYCAKQRLGLAFDFETLDQPMFDLLCPCTCPLFPGDLLRYPPLARQLDSFR